MVSNFLDREAQDATLRIRFFDPVGALRDTAEAIMMLDVIQTGYLFGGADEILAITSEQEHAYTSTTDMWLLPKQGKPRHLLGLNATFGKFSRGNNGARPGVWLRRSTYDGIHAETKGWADEFWAWNSSEKSLALENKGAQ